MMKNYKTLKCHGVCEIVIKKSRFIANAAPVETENATLAFIEEIRTQHRTASCNPYAFYLRQNSYAKYSDDGELSGSAGLPILEVVKREGLVDCAIVVTRYYGGIKLGAGGLLRAFAGAAKAGIDEAGIVERRYCNRYNLTVAYHDQGRVDHEIREHNAINTQIEYADNIKIVTYIPFEDTCGGNTFEADIVEVTNGKAVVEKDERGIYI